MRYRIVYEFEAKSHEEAITFMHSLDIKQLHPPLHTLYRPIVLLPEELTVATTFWDKVWTSEKAPPVSVS